MPAQTMTLKEAAKVLGVSADTVRHRFRKGELPGRWDNQGRILVDVDPESTTGRKAGSGRKSRDFQPDNARSFQHGNSPEIEAIRDHLETLRQQLEATRAERDRLWAAADEATRLAATAAGLQEAIADRERTIADLREDRDHWRIQAERATLILTDQRATRAADQVPAAPAERSKGWRGFLLRLAGMND